MPRLAQGECRRQSGFMQPSHPRTAAAQPLAVSATNRRRHVAYTSTIIVAKRLRCKSNLRRELRKARVCSCANGALPLYYRAVSVRPCGAGWSGAGRLAFDLDGSYSSMRSARLRLFTVKHRLVRRIGEQAFGPAEKMAGYVKAWRVVPRKEWKPWKRQRLPTCWKPVCTLDIRPSAGIRR